MDFFQTTISKKAISLAKKTLDSTFISAGKVSIQFDENYRNAYFLQNFEA